MGEKSSASVDQQARARYEQAESQAARAWEEVVGRESFAELLARLTENVMGVTRIGNDAFDLLVRNLRLAGRRDITKLAAQLARTEDKLELVLQEIERLRDELAAADDDPPPTPKSRSSNGRSQRKGGAGARSR